VAVRHGRGLAWARGKVEGLRLFSAARVQNLREDPQLLEQVLHSNEHFIRSATTRAGLALQRAFHPGGQPGQVLEAVLPAHRWGKVTHERHWHHNRHL